MLNREESSEYIGKEQSHVSLFLIGTVAAYTLSDCVVIVSEQEPLVPEEHIHLNE